MDMTEFSCKMLPKIEDALHHLIPPGESTEMKSVVQKRIGRFEHAFYADAWKKAVAEPIHALLGRGGKRVRPLLSILTHYAFGGQHPDIFRVAAISECVHNGTLIVDDIEDASPTRRGGPAIHRMYGEAISINAGNLLYFFPVTVLSSIDVSPKMQCELYQIITHDMARLHIGQAMDIFWGKQGITKVTIEEYLQMCAYKTGSLLAVAIKMGAVLAGVTSQLESLQKIAINMGIAFQIRDDILNLKPTGEWGKEFGEDITEGKITYMASHSLHHSKEPSRLQSILAAHTHAEQEIKEAIHLMEESGSFAAAQEYAQRLLSEAEDIVQDVFPESEYKTIFREYIRYMMERKK